MDFKLQTLFNPTLICLFTVFFSTFASEIASLDKKFKACAPRSCGNGPNISYPFWISGVHEPFCGYPDFKIVCNDEKYPVLEISGEGFIIEDIFPQNHSFLLVSPSAYGYEHSCPSHNTSLTRTPFRCTLDNEDFFFFYDCLSKPADQIYELNCSSDDSSLFSFATFHQDLSEHSCHSSIRLPIRKNPNVSPNVLGEMNYVEILKMGFVLNWTAQYCSGCDQSGGLSGFENNNQ